VGNNFLKLYDFRAAVKELDTDLTTDEMTEMFDDIDD
jgi:hypothetical protein